MHFDVIYQAAKMVRPQSKLYLEPIGTCQIGSPKNPPILL